MMKGVFLAKKKSGVSYYRASFTYKNRHISLGSFPDELSANKAYLEAMELVTGTICLSDYLLVSHSFLPFEKGISIINFRDNDVYFRNPIYLQNKFFYYYLDPDIVYTFDIDDLFYYAEHKISKRNGHLFVADYGMQVNILSRYGIMSHAVAGRDYKFINGNPYDFRYENIEIINHYFGVIRVETKNKTRYRARILVHGLYTIGEYETEEEAAIAYNKAADLLQKKLPNRTFRQNYIENLSPSQYASIYTNIKIAKKITDYE